MRAARICIYVQHLVGGGHLVRMRALADALAHAGHAVTLICGGEAHASRAPALRYAICQLPPVHAKPDNLAQLLDAAQHPLSDSAKAARAAQLCDAIADAAPQALIIETFPFGRRMMRFELLPLMHQVEAMRSRPLMVCSVRDVLQLRTLVRARQTVREINQWFDGVVVHADPTMMRLSETFAYADQLRDKIFYSGYLHNPPRACANDVVANDINKGINSDINSDTNNNDTNDAPRRDARNEVIVSAGFGAVGLNLLRVAVAAKPLGALRDCHWRILASRRIADADFIRLQQSAGDGVTVERTRDDFAARLGKCRASISQAGYNTTLDVVAANCPAVFVPYAHHFETEQSHRAEKFAALGRAVVVAEAELTPTRLADAVARAAQLDWSHLPPLDLRGATRTANWIEQQLQQRANR